MAQDATSNIPGLTPASPAVVPSGRHSGSDPGVVDEHVDVAKVLHRRVFERRARSGVARVGLDGQRLCEGHAQTAGSPGDDGACA